MRRRRVGKWPLEVSEIALGTGDTAGGIVYGLPQQQRRLVERALELGINLFDCSPDYGKGLGEANLGRVLGELGVSDEALIITKVEIMPEELETGRASAKVEQSIEDSLLRLQRTHVDVLMLHNPVRLKRNPDVRVWMRLTPDDVMNEILPALQRVRDAGKTRFLGLACETSETQAVSPLLATGEFAMVNAWYNLTNPTAATQMAGFPPEEDYSGLFDLVSANGAAVAVIRPLAGGALTDSIIDRGAEGRHDLSRGYYRQNPRFLEPEIDRGRRFKFLSKEGQTLSEASYRYILAHPAVCTIIGGFSDNIHIDEAARAADKGPLSAAELEKIRRLHQEGFSSASAIGACN